MKVAILRVQPLLMRAALCLPEDWEIRDCCYHSKTHMIALEIFSESFPNVERVDGGYLSINDLPTVSVVLRSVECAECTKAELVSWEVSP